MNVYSADKISSTSEAELDLLGRSAWTTNQLVFWYHLGSSLAVTKIPDLTYPNTNMAGYEPDKMNIIGNFISNTNNLSMDGRINLNENLDIALSSLNGNVSSNKLSFSGRYEFINAKTVSRLVENLENITFSSKVNSLYGNYLGCHTVIPYQMNSFQQRSLWKKL